MPEHNPDFLKKYTKDRRKQGEEEAVESAAERTHRRTGKEVPKQDIAVLIQNYLNRFTEILERPDPAKRTRGIEELKNILHQKLIIAADSPVFAISQEERIQAIIDAERDKHGKPLDDDGKPYPLSHFDRLILRHYEEGRGIGTVPDEERTQEMMKIIKDQTDSLDTWIDYLVSEEAKYPDWLKYFAFRNIITMSKYDKDTKQFGVRTKRTLTPFPDLNREALAFVFDAIEKKYKKQSMSFPYDIKEEGKKEFQDALQKENFPKLYAWAIDKINPVSEDLMKITDGTWFTYPKGSDPMTYVPSVTLRKKTYTGQPLIPSLQNYATGWCIRGEATAKRYLENNELDVFYSFDSLDKNRQPTIPRVVMVKNGDRITEVRGVAEQENLDPHIGDVVQKRLDEHPDGKSFTKKSTDMQRLTAIEHKTNARIPLTMDDLLFLYELNTSIEGFGYQRDPRIKELRDQRREHVKADMLVIFGCTNEQEIADNVHDINDKTKAYVGKLEPGIFQILGQHKIDHIYTSFPDGHIRREELTIGGKSPKELEAALEEKDSQGRRLFEVSSSARSLLRSRDFKTIKQPEDIAFVRLAVRDLGFPDGATTDEIFRRAGELGLELCPAEVGPHYRLQNTDQPMNDWFYVGMKQITGSGGLPGVFRIGRDGDGLWLRSLWTDPDGHWNPGFRFAFRLRPSTRLRAGKSETQKP